MTTNKKPSTLDFIPKRFIRCHSRNNDGTDTSTQIWACQFEPCLESPAENPQTTDIIAACGGYSITLIETSTGKVVMKHNSKNKNEVYYCLMWTTLTLDEDKKRRINILAVGGSSGVLELFHPASCLLYKSFTVFKNAGVSSVCSDPNIPQRLFCSSMSGDIAILDIGVPAVPDYIVKPKLLYTLNLRTDVQVFQLLYNVTHRALFAAASDGLYALRFEEGSGGFRAARTQIDLSECCEKATSVAVDTIALITKDLLAVKPVGTGKIVVIGLDQLCVKQTQRKTGDVTVVVAKTPCAVLSWSKTDECFMNMAATNGDLKYLACGDNAGMLWVYDLTETVKGFKNIRNVQNIEPVIKLPWPKTSDPHIEINNKLPIRGSEVLVDSVAWSSNARHLVGVTSRNLICFWEKQ